MANIGSLIPWRDKPQAPSRDDDHLDPFRTFRREMDRMFDDFFAGSVSRWPAAFGGSATGGTLHAEAKTNAPTATRCRTMAAKTAIVRRRLKPSDATNVSLNIGSSLSLLGH